MRILGHVIKSQSDSRIYKAIRLKNQIDCLLITDSKAKKSSAALSVGVGSLQDPMQAQGLAHYLEHMLFMGTKKYPDENDYSHFLAKNFGSSNAYTSQQETNFFFEVSSVAFQETLDRFANFFIAPIMSDSSSERQLNAVHSQHSKNVLNDMWRKFQLTKHLAKKGHPFNKFSTGDKNSLANPSLRTLLHNFYEKSYSSNLMKLVVYGNQSLDELVQIVEDKFSPIPNNSYLKYKMTDFPYERESLKKMYKITPIKDKKVLELVWFLPDQSMHYQNCPGQYLSHIIGHQGKGSLLSFLIKEGYATGLSCGSSDNYNNFTQFQIKLSLTDQGLKNVQKVIEHVLFYIEILKKKKPEEWIFNQIKEMKQIQFDFQDQRRGMSFVSGLASRLHKHSVEEIIAYPYFMKQWKPSIIQNFISSLKNDNLMIFLQAKQTENQCNLVEPVYKTKYGVTNIDSLEPRSCDIHLPTKNLFIPKDFSIISKGVSTFPHPCQPIHPNRTKLWFKKNHQFSLPKLNLKMKLHFQGSGSVREAVAQRIFLQMLEEEMREFNYEGQMASIGSSVDFSSHFSMDINITGFSDSVLKFTHPYISQILKFQPKNKEYFKTLQQKLKRQYSNYFLGDPYRLTYLNLMLALKNGLNVAPRQKLEEIEKISFEEVINYGRYWIKKVYMTAYLSGNIEEKEGKVFLREIEEFVTSQTSALLMNQINQIRAICLPPQKTWIIEEKVANADDQNSAVVVYFQQQKSSVREKLLLDLCLSFIKQPAFDYLRTKQQLGYIVMCMPDENRGVLGISILVQSSIKTSYELTNYINIFLEEILKEHIKNLNEEEFSNYKKSLRNSITEPDKHMIEQSGRIWKTIVHGEQFLSIQDKLAVLKEISLEELKNFINILFYISSRRAQSHYISHHNADKNEELKKERMSKDERVQVVADAITLRKKLPLYPDFYSPLQSCL